MHMHSLMPDDVALKQTNRACDDRSDICDKRIREINENLTI